MARESQSAMDTWVPIVLVALAVVAIVVVPTLRAARSRGAPREDDDDDAARGEGADAYYRSQRDQTDYAPGAANTRNPRKTTP